VSGRGECVLVRARGTKLIDFIYLAMDQARVPGSRRGLCVIYTVLFSTNSLERELLYFVVKQLSFFIYPPTRSHRKNRSTTGGTHIPTLPVTPLMYK
jgi:hypothetical protein